MISLKSDFAVQAAKEQFSPEFVFAAEYPLLGALHPAWW